MSYEKENQFIAGLQFLCHRVQKNERLATEGFSRDFVVELGFERQWERKDKAVTSRVSKHDKIVWKQMADRADGAPGGTLPGIPFHLREEKNPGSKVGGHPSGVRLLEWS